MKFEVEYIEKLAKIIADNELTEISLEEGEQAITIRKDLPEVISAGMPMPVAAPVAAATPAQPSAPATAEAAEPAKKGNAIVSPMVGTFYSKPSPDAEPFVKVGDTVSAGDTVCIVEAMKLMNQIESEFSGKITEICVQDGQAVEYGQTIMYVE
ncbi:MAG: acetyl-CoA carboxylase biotin carboxyl carrier protein [Candidatus Gastranaerophilales bacterium]|nr:acetyl-CoA carboxylase biotin carboxyl carrier protein [Candidatus Gastranaerophilales bacterium]